MVVQGYDFDRLLGRRFIIWTGLNCTRVTFAGFNVEEGHVFLAPDGCIRQRIDTNIFIQSLEEGLIEEI